MELETYTHGITILSCKISCIGDTCFFVYLVGWYVGMFDFIIVCFEAVNYKLLDTFCDLLCTTQLTTYNLHPKVKTRTPYKPQTLC